MAFVFRSKKETIFTKNLNKYDTAPGQYISQEDPTHKLVPNKAPFLSTSLKDEMSLRKRKSPGPGAYYIDNLVQKYQEGEEDQKQAKDNIKAVRGISPEDMIKYEKILNLKQDTENLGFGVRDQRFKTIKKDKSPGPGYYVKSKDKKFRQLEEKNKENRKAHQKMIFKSDPKDNNKVVSIPGKFQAFGYDITEDGNLIMNSSDIDAYQGDKKDAVGPGRYDVEKSLNWFKRGTEWSKSKTNKFTFGKPERKSNKLSQSFDDAKYTDQVEEERVKVYRAGNLAFKKCIIDGMKTRRKNMENVIRTEMKEMDYINRIRSSKQKMQKTFSGNPGPGYYFQEEDQNKFYSNTKHNFMSNLRRFETNKFMNSHVGPGTYFNESEANFSKKKINEKIGDCKMKYKKKEIKTHREEPRKCLPGPGDYNPETYYNNQKKNFSVNSFFGTTQRRFAEKEETTDATPGPGSYISNLNTTANSVWTSNVVIKKLFKTKKGRLAKEPNELRHNNSVGRLATNKEALMIPPVGTYNPDMVFNIDYKNNKKINRMSIIEPAFNSNITKPRFDEMKDLDHLGPGYYYKEKKPLPDQIYPPFKTQDMRFKESRKHRELAGPGTYNMTSYHDWNRKSYNALFL